MYVKHIYLKRPYQSDCPQRTQLRIAVHFTIMHEVTEIAEDAAIPSTYAASGQTNSAGVTRPSPLNRLRRGESVPHSAGEHSKMALRLRLVGYPAQTEQKPLITDNAAEASQAYSGVKQYVESTTKEHHHAESLPA
jgi:hypothetical protein